MRKKKLKFEVVNETIINYSKSIKYFMDYIGPEFNIYDISKADMNNYISDMLEKVQSNTIRVYCKLIKVFFKYFDLDIEFDMPAENFYYKDVYSAEEIEKLLQPPKRKNFSTMRDHVMVSFLLGTGVRMKIHITLKVKEVDLVNNKIFLSTTKTKKDYWMVSTFGYDLAVKIEDIIYRLSMVFIDMLIMAAFTGIFIRHLRSLQDFGDSQVKLLRVLPLKDLQKGMKGVLNVL